MMLLAPFLLVAQIGASPILVADTPPQLDVSISCQAAAHSGVDGRTEQACMNEENTAQTTLKERWPQYAGNERERCTGLVRTGGPASYVELLTCLDLAAQARKLPKGDALYGATPATATSATTPKN